MILALDFEGTNKDPRKGAPCQIGLAVMDGEGVIASDEWLIAPPRHYKTGKPTREVDAYALEVSGLTLADIESGLTSYLSCARLASFVKDNNAGSLPVVAYNIGYDYECYGQMLYDGGHFDRDVYEYLPFGDVLGAKWICAFRMSRRLLSGDLIKFSLDDVAAYFGLSRVGGKHGALEDAILAGRIYARLLARSAQRGAA